MELPGVLLLVVPLLHVTACNMSLSEKSVSGDYSIVRTVPEQSGEVLSREDQVQVCFTRKEEGAAIRTLLGVRKQEGEIRGTWQLSENSWLFTPSQPYQEDGSYYLVIQDPGAERKIHFTFRLEDVQPLKDAIHHIGYFDPLDAELPTLYPAEAEGSEGPTTRDLPPQALPCIICDENHGKDLAETLVQDPRIPGAWHHTEGILRFFPRGSEPFPETLTLMLEDEPLVVYKQKSATNTLEEVIIGGVNHCTLKSPFDETLPGEVESTASDGGVTITLLLSDPVTDDAAREDLLNRIAVTPLFPEGSPYPVLTGFQWLTEGSLFLAFRNCLSYPPGKRVHYRLTISPGLFIAPGGVNIPFEVVP